jgi:dienelactone hydrolase
MKDDSAAVLSHQTIQAWNPGNVGTFTVKALFYGSGTDKQRPEYRDQVTIKTKTVDASPFASIPATAAKTRKDFFGFDLKKAPINARVWYPDGAGPFPLVLIVHGNHDWKQFSDPGYAYLGQLLASRGFIMASVDENFLNGLGSENDARAWVLLKHLEAWRQFNEAVDGPFYHRVDMNQIALMGHSRGGEAVAIAASFNKLRYYPDDFKQEFHFNFAIKSIVAIAPVDGQYKPTGQPTPIENVNYLIIHGSHDGDVSTAMGVRQYERVQFTDGQPWFKAVMFMYRANHGQWNTVWGNKDGGSRSGRSLDLRALIDPEEQRQFAKVAIGGFLEATLHGNRDYLPMFRDYRTVGAWLPKTIYTTAFEESGYHALAEYSEDVDLTTGTAPGVTIDGQNLSTWNESPMPFRGRGTDTQNHNGAWIGWNRHLAPTPPKDTDTKGGAEATPKPAERAKAGKTDQTPEEDKGPIGPPASYAISIPAALLTQWHIGDQSAVYLSLAVTNTKPGPRQPPKKEGDEAKADDKPADKSKTPPKPKTPAKPKPPEKSKEEKEKEELEAEPVDLTIELADAEGQVARLPLSHFGVAHHPLDARIYRRDGRDAQRFTNIYELIAQTFVLPVADFIADNPALDPHALASIRLVFDRTEAGTIIVEHAGLSTPAEPAFLAARVH